MRGFRIARRVTKAAATRGTSEERAGARTERSVVGHDSGKRNVERGQASFDWL